MARAAQGNGTRVRGWQKEGDGEWDRLGFFLPIEEEEIQSMIDKQAKYSLLDLIFGEVSLF